MGLNIRIHTNTINEHIHDGNTEKKFDFDGKISRIIVTDNKVVFLIAYEKSEEEKSVDYDSVYCFDFNGQLIWKSGKYLFEMEYLKNA